MVLVFLMSQRFESHILGCVYGKVLTMNEIYGNGSHVPPLYHVVSLSEIHKIPPC